MLKLERVREKSRVFQSNITEYKGIDEGSETWKQTAIAVDVRAYKGDRGVRCWNNPYPFGLVFFFFAYRVIRERTPYNNVAGASEQKCIYTPLPNSLSHFFSVTVDFRDLAARKPPHLKNIEGQSISAHLKQCITPSLLNKYASIPLHFDWFIYGILFITLQNHLVNLRIRFYDIP